ncbi:MAG: RNA polymerase sigma factor [Pikeienuella sp.]
MSEASRVAEVTARESYGRILAYLAARTHDIALAEDALADAFAKALSKWPETGVPANPDGWLLTVARNRLTDAQRRAGKFPTDSEMPDELMQEGDERPFGDQRLALMMVCAHPAIAADLHTPLMLQTVLGIEAKVIAALFLTSPAALSKRLVRAKAKVRDAGIPFHLPDADQLPQRSGAIMEAIYALHAHDWLDPADGMGEEALYLASLAARLMADNAEVLGLLALIAFSHARRDARIVDGVLAPTEMQDVALWDDGLIRFGHRQLRQAYQLASIGRFQVEAAIEAVHLARKTTGETDWAALNKLYHAYLKTAPSAGAVVSQAVVSANLFGPEVGLDALTKLEAQIGTGFQPLWAARAELFSRAGGMDQARVSYEKAISLTTDLPVLRFLREKLSAL